MTPEDRLNKLVESKEYVSIDGIDVKIVSWDFDGVNVILKTIDKRSAHNTVTKKIVELIKEIGDGVNKYSLGYLRKKLIDQIEGIESGDIDVGKAKAVSMHVQTIVNMTKLELEYKKAIAKDFEVDGTKFIE